MNNEEKIYINLYLFFGVLTNLKNHSPFSAPNLNLFFVFLTKNYIKQHMGKNQFVVRDSANNTTNNINTYTLHHVIPYNIIIQLVRNVNPTNQTDIDTLQSKFDVYINLPHIKPLVEHALMPVNIQPRHNHGHILHAAMTWNPHNVVPGPLPQRDPNHPKDYYRTDDPGSLFDQKLYDKQYSAPGVKSNFQNQVDDFFRNPSLAAYGNISDVPNPVEFARDPNLNDPSAHYVAP